MTYYFSLTAYNRFPASTINDALAACDIIGVTRAVPRLRHGEVAVSVGHGQPAEHVLVWSLAQRTFVLPLDPRPRLFIHVVVWPPTCAGGLGWSLHVKWVCHNIRTALQVCSQNEGCSLHPGDDGFCLGSHLRIGIRRDVFFFVFFISSERKKREAGAGKTVYSC